MKNKKYWDIGEFVLCYYNIDEGANPRLKIGNIYEIIYISTYKNRHVVGLDGIMYSYAKAEPRYFYNAETYFLPLEQILAKKQYELLKKWYFKKGRTRKCKKP